LAAQILGTGEPALLDRVAQYKRDLEATVLAKVKKMAADRAE
jgi:phosphoribosylcarboxyaminoimidazole (NCAIR) mutase